MAAGITFSKDLQGRGFVKIDMSKYGSRLMDFFRENQVEEKAQKHLSYAPTPRLTKAIQEVKEGKTSADRDRLLKALK